MTTHSVSQGGLSLSAAAGMVQPGDTVIIRPGVYRERLIANVPDVAWKGEPGAVLDGGYSYQWARKSGDGWVNLVYRAPAESMGDIISVRANGVIIDGLTIQNSGQAGISVGAFSDVHLLNNTITHCYRTAIVVNGTGGTAQRIVIEGNVCNVASVCIFDPDRSGLNQGVSGVIKAGNCRGVVIRGNVVSRGFGEGINCGKDAIDMLIEDNDIHDCNHIHIYVNRAQGVMVRGNRVFCTGDPAHLWSDKSAPCGIAIRDETTRGGNFPTSADVTFENNTVVNMGYPLLINAENGGGGGFVVKSNTFVWGEQARQGITIVGRQPGIFSGNRLYVTTGKAATTNTPQAMVFRDNLWTVAPPQAWRGDGDVYGPIDLLAPDVMPSAIHGDYGMGEGFTFNAANYAPAVVEPPPPVDPPPVEPPVNVLEELAIIKAITGEARLALDQALARLARLSDVIKAQ